MKFSEHWLRSFVDPDLGSEDLAHCLTMAGLEVEALEAVAPPFDGVVVGEVLTLDKHPDADRLQVCAVDAGAAAPLQIVCGAKNVRVGARVPCALVGAKLPGMAIKPARVRGVESQGMLCSAQELKLAEASEGLLLLPEDAPVGMDLREYLGLDDKVFTLKLTPNRSDCLSVAGVAREVSALTGAPLALPEIGAVESDAAAGSLEVRVLEPEACPRYCGRIVRGIDPSAATPDWMARRLERSGLRGINPVVDVTNYVMLELGQPLHAFDLGKLAGGVTVRLARPGERLALLNEQTASLEPDMLVVADDAKALALAGVMGGMESAVGEATTDIFLESAFFSPAAIAGKARRLGLSTDSSHRFERGVDFAAVRDALERATRLILEICGGCAGEVTEVSGVLPRREPIRLRADRASRVLGVALDGGQIESLLRRQRLAFSGQAPEYLVTSPSYRFDLGIEADLIEELARLYGYDNIPASVPRGGVKLIPRPEGERGPEALRGLLAARDYREVINYSFVDESWERDLAGNAGPVRLQNPLASQMAVMRSTLLGGLVDCLHYNLNREQERVRLFEVGRCFSAGPAGEEPFLQPVRIAALCYGAVRPEQWGEAGREPDFYDVKADVEALCWPEMPRFTAAAHPALHPGQCARVWLGDEHLGWLGMLHPQWRQKYALPRPVGLFELDLAPLQRRKAPAFREFSKFPQVRRDIAVVVAENIAVQEMLDALREASPPIVAEVGLFDVYRGKGIDSDKKSLAFRVLMQDTRKTLTDQDADDAVMHLTQLLTARFHAKLRT